ncbi:MAG: NADH-quinone oxidoreductase subunit NuoI [Nitrospirae bacterium]|nr:NADH-quinone oxidoreductase subunit NuoI [Nitrospirota bacterium]
MSLSAALNKVFFGEIVKGLGLTFKHLFEKSITQQYPHTKPMLPDGYRGIMSLLKYDDGTERCVGCALCEIACPSNVIKVVSAEEPGRPLNRYAKTYTFDVTRCVFCGFCVDACPVDALAMTKEYEWASENKRTLFLDKDQLLAIGDRNFPLRGKKPEYRGSIEGDWYLTAVKAKAYPKQAEKP